MYMLHEENAYLLCHLIVHVNKFDIEICLNKIEYVHSFGLEEVVKTVYQNKNIKDT